MRGAHGEWCNHSGRVNDIRRGWTSLVIVALLVAIAGGAVMAGVAGARRAGRVRRPLRCRQRVPRTSPSTPKARSTQQFRAELMADSRVSDVGDARIMLATPTSLLPGLGGSTVVFPDEYWGDLLRPRIVEGAYPSGPDEIAVTERTAAELGFDVGQAVDMWLLTPAGRDTFFTTGEFLPEDAGTVTVTAILRTPADIEPDSFASGSVPRSRGISRSAGWRSSRHGPRHRHLPHARHGDRRRRQRLLDEGRRERRTQSEQRARGRPSCRRPATRRAPDRHGHRRRRRAAHRRTGLRQVPVTTILGCSNAGCSGNAVGPTDDGWLDARARRRSTGCSARRSNRHRIVTVVPAARRTTGRP